eukprot:UN04823
MEKGNGKPEKKRAKKSGHKCYADGTFAPFIGCTIISFVHPKNAPKWCERLKIVYDVLCDFNKRFKCLAILPQDSYHVTTFNLIHQNHTHR